MGKITINETASKKSTEVTKKDTEGVSVAKKSENTEKKPVKSEKSDQKAKPAAKKMPKTDKNPQTKLKTVQKIVIAHFDASERIEPKEDAATEMKDASEQTETVKQEAEKVEIKDTTAAEAETEPAKSKPETPKAMSELEVERLSDSADVLAGVQEAMKAEVETEEKAGVVSAKGARQAAAGTVMDFRASTKALKIDDLDDEVEPKAKIETAQTGQPKFSKPKAMLMAVGAAIIVGLIGGVIIWLMGRKEVPQCVVQFESNGGTAVEDITMACGKVISRPDDPTKEGFDFKGWIYDGEPFDFKTMKAAKNMILQADWVAHENTETVIVKFNADGGSAIKEIEVKKGGTIPKAPVSSRGGYKLVGWYTDTNDEFREFIFGKDKVESDMTLVAVWERIPVQTPPQGSNEQPAEEPKEEAKLEVSAPENVSMKVGETKEISVLIGATPEDLEYRTAVSVSSEGLLSCSNVVSEGRIVCTALGAGEERVTVVARGTVDGNSVVASRVISVSILAVPVSSVTITGVPSEAQAVGAVITLGATILPADATNRRVTWTSSDESLAKVEGGKVTIVGQADEPKTVTITARAGDQTATITITVAAKVVEQPPVVVPSVEIEGGDRAMTVGGSEALKVTVSDDLVGKDVVWSSSNDSVATVEGGVITAVGTGEATITATIDGVSASIEITVGGGETPPSES